MSTYRKPNRRPMPRRTRWSDDHAAINGGQVVEISDPHAIVIGCRAVGFWIAHYEYRS